MAALFWLVALKQAARMHRARACSANIAEDRAAAERVQRRGGWICAAGIALAEVAELWSVTRRRDARPGSQISPAPPAT